MRDIAKVFQGLLMANCRTVSDNDMFAKLWLHETSRVFLDRLSTREDIEFFKEEACLIMQAKFKVKQVKKEIVFAKNATPLFSVMMNLDSGNEVIGYDMVENRPKLLERLE
jgi:dynein heavy chain